MAKKKGAKGRYNYWLTDQGLKRLAYWAQKGLTDKQICEEKIGISQSTFYDWKRRFPEFSESLKKAKLDADIEVVNALHQKATGFTSKEVSEEEWTDPTTGKKVRKKRTTTKYVPPDTGAIALWLKNRQPDEWRDKREVEISGTVGIADVLRAARERAVKACEPDRDE